MVPNPTNYDNWMVADAISLSSSLCTVAIVGVNLGTQNPAGIIAYDSNKRLWTNSSWRCSNTLESGWTTAGFDDSAWPAAKSQFSYGNGAWGTNAGLTAGSNVYWIWTSGLDNKGNPSDSVVYCRILTGIAL